MSDTMIHDIQAACLQLFGEPGSDEYEKFIVLVNPAMKVYWDSGLHLEHKKRPLSCSVTRSGGAGVSISISAGGLAFIHFVVDPTQACCAMSFLHSFSVSNSLPQAQVDAIMDIIMYNLTLETGMPKSRRLIVNMVEYRGSHTNPTEKLEPIDNPKMAFPTLWSYFHKRAEKVNTMLMPNANTGAVIHHMEVIFSTKFLSTGEV